MTGEIKWSLVAIVEGQPVVVGDDFDPDDADEGTDVHIVPCTQLETHYTFGAHEFTRSCYCHPSIETQGINSVRIIHKNSVN